MTRIGFLAFLLLVAATEAAPAPKPKERPTPQVVELHFDIGMEEAVLVRVGGKQTRFPTGAEKWQEKLSDHLAEVRTRAANKDEMKVHVISDMAPGAFILTLRVVRK